MTTPIRIRFPSAKEGGRRNPPGLKYSTVAVFEHPVSGATQWSVVVEFGEQPKLDHWQDAEMSFLTMPDISLTPDTRFHLIEGKKRVAIGQAVSIGKDVTLAQVFGRSDKRAFGEPNPMNRSTSLDLTWGEMDHVSSHASS
jgi:hypothetical protein